MLAVYWSLIGVLVLLSGFLIYYYADPKAALYAKLLVFVSFTSSLLCFVILPIDIYESSWQSQRRDSLLLSWKVIFYINFFMCWLVLPFAQEYQDSGEFSFGRRLRESLIMNGILIGGLCAGAVGLIIYLVAVSSFTFSQLPAVFATLVNVFGLSLVSVFMGYGLVSLPKQCWARRDHRSLVSRCHRHAESIKTQQETILEEVYTIRQILEREQERNKHEVEVVHNLIQDNFKFHNYCGYEPEEAKALTKKSTADLHKIVKKRTLQYKALASELDELVDDLRQVTEGYLHNNYSRQRVLYTLLLTITILVSACVFLAEVATFLGFLQPINLLRLMGRGGEVAFALNVILASYVAFVVVHSVFRIKVYKIFALYRGHSSASSLLFTAINLSRVAYPLCFNYLQITDMPPSSFLSFFGEVTIPPQYAAIFPGLMVIFGLCNAFDVYDRVAGYLGLASYAFDQEEAQEKKDEGRTILIQRFKERNLQNNQLEMIQLL